MMSHRTARDLRGSWEAMSLWLVGVGILMRLILHEMFSELDIQKREPVCSQWSMRKDVSEVISIGNHAKGSVLHPLEANQGTFALSSV
jgi:hypothetical protein